VHDTTASRIVSLTAECVPGPGVEGSSIVAVTVTQKSNGVMPATSAQPLGAVGDPGVRET